MAKRNLTVGLTGREKLWGSVYLLAEFLILPNALRLIADRLFPGTSELTVNFLFYFINFLAVLLIFHRFLWKNLGIARRRLLPCCGWLLLGLVLYFGGNAALSYLTYAIKPDFVNINDQTIAQISRDGALLMAVGTVILVPTAEECLFRGLLFRWPYGKSRLAAYALSTAVFSLVHILGYIGTADWLTLVLCFVQYLPAGCALAFAYEKSNTIAVPIAMHTIINAIGSFIVMR